MNATGKIVHILRHAAVALPMVAIAMTARAAIPTLTINVPENTTWDFVTALRENGLDETFPTAAYIDKTGLGTLIATNIFCDGTVNKNVSGTYVHGGVLRASGGWDIGCHGSWMTVYSGGTVEHAFKGSPYSRNWTFNGAGAAGQRGALVCKGSPYFIDMRIILGSDTTFATEYAGGYTRLLGKAYHPSLGGITLRLAGHTMKLVAADGCPGFSYGDQVTLGDASLLDGSGTILVDGTTLTEENTYKKDDGAVFAKATGAEVTVKLANGAKFLPTQQKFVSLLTAIETEYGTTVDGKTSAFEMTIPQFAGAGTIGANITSLVVSNRFTVDCAELSSGHAMTASGSIVFGDDCELVVTGDIRNLNPDAEGKVTIATSATGITGCPTIVRTTANRHWSAEAGADGKSIVLVYSSGKPEGSIDVRAEWGVVTGESGVTGNAKRFNDSLAVAAGENIVLYFPSGDYYFDEPLTVARGNVTILGDSGDSVLHAADDGMTEVLAVSGDSVTVTQLTFADCDGVAAAATGTANFAFTNNFYTAIGGTIDGATGTHPVSAKNATSTCVKFNRVTDGAAYASLCYHDGGTKTADSDPYANRRIWVDGGDTEQFMTAFAKMGLGSTYSPAAEMEKWGPGTLIATNTFGGGGGVMRPITIAQGTYHASQIWDLGAHANTVIVKDGATLEHDFINNPYARLMRFAGSGAAGQSGALVLNGNAAMIQMSFELTDDATVATGYKKDYSRFLGRGQNSGMTCNNYYLNGHELRLVALEECPGFSYGDQLLIRTSGTITVDGTTLAEKNFYTADDKVSFAATDGAVVALKLTNGASFLPRQQLFVSLLSSIDTEFGTTVNGREKSFEMSIPQFAGACAVGANVTTLSIADRLTLKCDEIAAGHALTVAGALAFGDDCALVLEGDAKKLVAPESGKIVIATSSTSISGCPTLVRTAANRHWSVAVDGGDLVLVYNDLKPEGAISVASWGVLPGADHAEGNAARFNDAIAALAGENPVIYFPEGDYYFDAPLNVGAKSGVSLVSDIGSAVLHGSAGASTVLNAVGSAGLTVACVSFADCTGTAIAASGTTGLAVSNCLYTAIGGTIDGVDGKYPIAVSGGSDTLIRVNRVLDGTTYAAAAYYDGGTRAAGCEPVAGEVHLWVDAGETEEFETALAKAGYGAYPDLARVVKEGAGTLIGTNRYTAQKISETVTSRICGLTVRGGIMRIAGEDDLGVKTWADSDHVIVEDGATCVVYGNKSWGLQNRGVHLKGSGAPGQYGALVITGTADLSYIQFRLDGDAVVCDCNKGRSRLLCTSNPAVSPYVKFNGHELRLVAAGECTGYLLERRLQFADSGTLAVDGTVLYETRESVGFPTPQRTAGTTTTLRLTNGAKFNPNTQNCVSMFDNVVTESGTCVDSLSTSLAMTVGGWKGLGDVAGLASLAVTNSFAVDAGEVRSGLYPTFSCPLTFAATAKVRLDDPDGLFTEAETFHYVCAKSEVSVDGTPRRDRASDFRFFRPGTDETTMFINPYAGTLIIVR